MSSVSCDKCGKECKDKRGLSIHYKKCDVNKHFECEFCNQEFVNSYTLSVHINRCKTLKTKKETMIKEELISLQSELKEAKEEITKLKDSELIYQNEISSILRLLKENETKLKESNEINKSLQEDKSIMISIISSLSLKNSNRRDMNDNPLISSILKKKSKNRRI